MEQLTPYLHFNGNCRAALTFYSDCIGGNLVLKPEDASAGKVMYASLENGGFLLMADDNGQSTAPAGGLTLYVDCSSKEELEASFAKLSAGGTVAQPLKAEYYGTVGVLVDKFGIHWMLKFNPKRA
jgi:PhnB protein